MSELFFYSTNGFVVRCQLLRKTKICWGFGSVSGKRLLCLLFYVSLIISVSVKCHSFQIRNEEGIPRGYQGIRSRSYMQNDGEEFFDRLGVWFQKYVATDEVESLSRALRARVEDWKSSTSYGYAEIALFTDLSGWICLQTFFPWSLSPVSWTSTDDRLISVKNKIRKRKSSATDR